MSVEMLKSLVGKERVTAQDVLRVRGEIYPDVAISPDEAEALFEVNDTARSTSPEWKMLFIEAMTDFVVRQQQPAGYVDAVAADWLCAHILRDGRVRSDTELELLIHILEEASQAPRALSRLALDQVVAFALTPERAAGDGPTLTGPEVERLRRVIYAFAGQTGGAGVSRDEAQTLFAINDAARGRPNNPAWQNLFVQAVGAAMMAAPAYQGASREEAAHQEAWLKAPTAGTVALLGRAFAAAFRGPEAGLDAMAEETPIERRNLEAAFSADRAAPVTGDEGAWLASMIGRDGTFDENEIALLRYVSRQASQIHPSLRPLIDRAMNQSEPGAAVFGRRAS
jgi:hypothetical protein